jgi:hypothetical protein
MAAGEESCRPRSCGGHPCPALPAGFEAVQCVGAAKLTVEIENRSNLPVTAMVDGELTDPSATCMSTDAAEYPPSEVSCEAGKTCIQAIDSLRPGTWVHRLSVQVPDGVSQLQRQSQRRVLTSSATTQPVNLVHWIVYPRTYISPLKGGELKARLDLATTFLEEPGHQAGALVTFDPTAFCAQGTPAPLLFGMDGCVKVGDCSAAQAGYCWTTSGLVLDALDRNGEPGGISVSEPALCAKPGSDPPEQKPCDYDVLRMFGHDNVVRGLHVIGATSPGMQADTLAFDGMAADNRLEDVIIDGPGMGDAVSAQCSSHDNTIVRGDIRHAADKGVKVTDGAQLEVADSCVSDNAQGGIQATRGGAATALRNLVQLNLPEGPQNGIWARGWPRNGQSGIVTPSSVRTDANLVRFNGAQGLAATDDAVAHFRNDYVANNQYAGARILSTAPCDAQGPRATLDGVAFVCNAATTGNGGPRLSGTCKLSKLPCRIGSTDCEPDVCTGNPPKGLGLEVGFGSGEFGCCEGACGTPSTDCDECGTCAGTCPSPAVALGAGRNAFVAHPVLAGDKAGQLVADDNVPTVDAHGNFWDDCSTPDCHPTRVKGLVETTPVATLMVDDPPTIESVWPLRPARGDLVRVWGSGFNAPATKPPGECAGTEPPADACDPSDSTLIDTGNTVSLRLSGTFIPTDLVAVTPTMLAFRMPVDCFDAEGKLTVEREGTASEAWPICETPGDCLGAPDGAPCEPDGLPCTVDVCRASVCTHNPAPVGTVCRTAVGACDVPETCDGIAGECPDDKVAPTSVICRPAASICDAVESCTGSSAACPVDLPLTGCTSTTTTTPNTTSTAPSTTSTTAVPSTTSTITPQSTTSTTAAPRTTSTIPAPTTTTTTASPSMTSTTAPSTLAPSTTTSTTEPCEDLPCVETNPACAGGVPRGIGKKLAKAADLIEKGDGGRPRKVRQRHKRACHILAQAGAKIHRAPHQKLSEECASSLLSAVQKADRDLACRSSVPR